MFENNSDNNSPANDSISDEILCPLVKNSLTAKI